MRDLDPRLRRGAHNWEIHELGTALSLDISSVSVERFGAAAPQKRAWLSLDDRPLENRTKAAHNDVRIMKVTEKDRLDFRQELERIFSNPKLAEIAMELMPPIDYDRLATKDDLAVLQSGVDAKFERVDAAMVGLQGALELRMAQQLRVILMAQAAMIAIVGGIVSAT